MEERNPEEFIEVRCSTGARVYWHRDFFDPKVREEITRNVSAAAAEIGKKRGFRVAAPEGMRSEK